MRGTGACLEDSAPVWYKACSLQRTIGKVPPCFPKRAGPRGVEGGVELGVSGRAALKPFLGLCPSLC